MWIDDARSEDAAGVAEIYNHAVAHGTAIWNEVTVDARNRALWLAERQDYGFAVLVARDDKGRVLGYAATGAFRAFDGYRRTVEHSVYVRADCRGQGIGEALLSALIARTRHDGFHVMVAAIEAGNAASIALHRKLGFVACGVLPEVGVKFGRWLDLALMSLRLAAQTPPE